MDIGYAAAFIGGVLALASPCSALLLPAFFAYSFADPTRLLARTTVFYAGLVSLLAPLGAASSVVGSVLNAHRDVLILLGGVVVAAMGVAQILGRGFASRRAQAAAGRLRPTSLASTYLLGAVYGLAGFCAGPILGSILTVAAVGGDWLRGGVLMSAYAFGMALPLFVTALLWDRFDLGERRWLRGRPVRVGRLRTHSTSLLSGLFFIVLAVVFVASEGTAALPGLLDAQREFQLQEHARRLGAIFSDVTFVLGAAAATVAVGWAVRRRRAARSQDTTAEEAAVDHLE